MNEIDNHFKHYLKKSIWRFDGIQIGFTTSDQNGNEWQWKRRGKLSLVKIF